MDPKSNGYDHSDEPSTSSNTTASSDGGQIDYGYGPEIPSRGSLEEISTAAFGHGDAKPDVIDYGYGDASDEEDSDDESERCGGGMAYGYGMGDKKANRDPPGGQRNFSARRRNSCLVKKDGENPLAVAEFLMGGPPLMSDKDLAAQKAEEEEDEELDWQGQMEKFQSLTL